MNPDNSNINTTASSDIDFVNWFRNAAPYINAFRGKTFVIYFSGDVLADNEFPSLVHDITLLNSLGVKLVLVHGARSQIEKRLNFQNIQPHFSQGLRVTDSESMQVIKEASGCIRLNIEGLFTTSLRYTPMASSRINIVSGNFTIAKPKGIIDGVDFQHTGEIRRIDTDSILNALNAGDVILMSPVGYSPTGEIFNINGEDLAAESSIALKADKLIFIDDISGIKHSDGQLINELTGQDLKQLLKDNTDLPDELKRHFQRIIYACESGVKRVHIIDRNIEGALLLELFTQNGIGTLISTDQLEDIRLASIEDVNGIIELISPLEETGLLVKRSRERLETEIENFYIIKRENSIIGCGALYPFNKEQAELACMAIAPEYQSQGRGDKLFNHICMCARRSGLKQLFVLTTQATHWFIEHGFIKGSLEDLPSKKLALYNYQRNSAVFIKELLLSVKSNSKNSPRSHKEKVVQPFLKWAGNKKSIIHKIKSLLPAGKRLIEPFCGSAAVFLNTAYKKNLIADCNSDLINIYQQLQKDGQKFIDYCEKYFIPENNSPEIYYQLREKFNNTRNKKVRAALFLYLNRHGYNGLCRYNKSGGFNVPVGRYKKITLPRSRMLYFTRHAQNAEFIINDFETSIKESRQGDVIYCDPPYVPLNDSNTSFQYEKNGFSMEQQKQLAKLAESAANRGIPVLISNHLTDFTREIYKNGELTEFSVRRTISCKGDKRVKAREVLALFQ